MLAVLAGLVLVAAPVDTSDAADKARTGDYLECLKAQIADRDDHISDAATIAKAAMFRCSGKLEAMIQADAAAHGVAADSPGANAERDGLNQMFSAVALEDVLDERKHSRASH